MFQGCEAGDAEGDVPQGVEGIACKNLSTLAVETSMKGPNTQAPNPRRTLVSLIREEPSRIEAAQACSYRPKYGGRPHYLREHAEYSTVIPLQFIILSHDALSEPISPPGVEALKFYPLP
jgi:hypothetical protein